MSKKNALKAITMVTINANTVVAGSYTVINATGFDESCNLIRVINRSKNDMHISFDGVTDHDYLKTDDEMQIPAPYSRNQSNFKKLTKVYAKGTTSIGYIKVVGYYRSN